MPGRSSLLPDYLGKFEIPAYMQANGPVYANQEKLREGDQQTRSKCWSPQSKITAGAYHSPSLEASACNMVSTATRCLHQFDSVWLTEPAPTDFTYGTIGPFCATMHCPGQCQGAQANVQCTCTFPATWPYVTRAPSLAEKAPAETNTSACHVMLSTQCHACFMASQRTLRMTPTPRLHFLGCGPNVQHALRLDSRCCLVAEEHCITMHPIRFWRDVLADNDRSTEQAQARPDVFVSDSSSLTSTMKFVTAPPQCTFPVVSLAIPVYLRTPEAVTE